VVRYSGGAWMPVSSSGERVEGCVCRLCPSGSCEAHRRPRAHHATPPSSRRPPLTHSRAQKFTKQNCAKEGVPDYFSVISKPMDLTRMKVPCPLRACVRACACVFCVCTGGGDGASAPRVLRLNGVHACGAGLGVGVLGPVRACCIACMVLRPPGNLEAVGVQRFCGLHGGSAPHCGQRLHVQPAGRPCAPHGPGAEARLRHPPAALRTWAFVGWNGVRCARGLCVRSVWSCVRRGCCPCHGASRVYGFACTFFRVSACGKAGWSPAQCEPRVDGAVRSGACT
jgi:hypothetical protein